MIVDPRYIMQGVAELYAWLELWTPQAEPRTLWRKIRSYSLQSRIPTQGCEAETESPISCHSLSICQNQSHRLT